MNSHDIAVAVYLALILTGFALQLLAGGNPRIPTFGRLLDRVMRDRSGRVGVTAAWVWLGLHFFAR